LDEAEDLINLVWNDISVLIFLVFAVILLSPLNFWLILFVLPLSPFQPVSNLFYFLFFIEC
jgi:hypothetical protein